MRDDLDLRALHQRYEPDPAFRAAVRRRVVQILEEGDRSGTDVLDEPVARTTALAPAARRASQTRRHWRPALAAAAAVAAIAVAIATIRAGEPEVVTSGPDAADAPFAAAIEAGEVLSRPSPDEVRLASNVSFYPPGSGTTQVSAQGSYVSLRTCWPQRSPTGTCTTGWAYITGSSEGGAVHRGVLGDAEVLRLSLVDDRYFVATEASPGAPPAAWIIDAVSGQAGTLEWRQDPTTLSSPEQALLLPDDAGAMFFGFDRPYEGFLPSVVDARDGTIRPLAVPSDAAIGVPIAQRGSGRIWVGTAPDGGAVGLAYTDDGGERWTRVALPADLHVQNGPLATRSFGDRLLEVAADGDRVAVTKAWGSNGDVFVTQNAGAHWTMRAVEPAGNGAHLYVLADRRLMLMWSEDPYPQQLLVSSGSGWGDLEDVGASRAIGHKYFAVNRAGIVFSYGFDASTAASGFRIEVSDDLRDWRTMDEIRR